MRDIQFLTATNDIMKDEGKHYVTVFVACTVVGDDAQPEVSDVTPTCDFFLYKKGIRAYTVS